MDGASVVVAVLAAVVIVLALVFYVVTLTWAGRNRVAPTSPGTDVRSSDARATPSRDRDSSGSLARGFSYLHISPRSSDRRPGVQQRLRRAYRRIDAVDPHVSSRRIGEALLQAGFVEPRRPLTGRSPRNEPEDHA